MLYEITISNVHKSMDEGFYLKEINAEIESFKLVQHITSDLSVLSKGNIYAFVRKDIAIGFALSGGNANIKDEKFIKIEAIYFDEATRKSSILGVFIGAFADILDRPIIISNNALGGSLSIDGFNLIKALARKSRAVVKLINLKTGELLSLDEYSKDVHELGWTIAIWPNDNSILFRKSRTKIDEGKVEKLFLFRNFYDEEELINIIEKLDKFED